MNLEIFNIEVVRALYIVSAVLFILTLGGLSNQETSRRGTQQAAMSSFDDRLCQMSRGTGA